MTPTLPTSRAEPCPEMAPALLSGLLYLRFRDDSVSLSEYGGYGPGGRTTAVAEILTTLEWLGAAARSALPRRRDLRRDPALAPELAARVDAAIGAIVGGEADAAPAADAAAPATACCCGSSRAALGVERPSASTAVAVDIGDVRFQDQDGEVLDFRDLFYGRPSIVVFFYTRCDNPTKCALTMTRLGRLQRLLRARGLGRAVRTTAITYDPAFDLPERLAAYAATWGVTPDADHRVVRTLHSFDVLRAYFDLGVNYVSSVVNRHRLETFVLDHRGRIDTALTRLRSSEEALAERAEALLGRATLRPAPPRSPLAPPPRSSSRRAADRGGRRTR